MNPVVSIDSVSITGLDDAGKGASASGRLFRLLPDTYTNGTVAVSCVGGAVTALGELRNVTLTADSPSVVSATVRSPATALPGDARDRLAGELRRGEFHLDVSLSYDRSSEHERYAPLSHGFRALCAATSLGRGNSTATASCTVVRKASPNDYRWF
ncbi:hypothetical protein E2562_030853 [Oryza meyeriana var. granulata]|uniref:Uncharacterized protein n=1 Tax=Oryza meyeriana var. granulata TaxID=110450 RepID=A0A6G1EZY9_9ORYZ|nr:hypothetical protein E2562_030853 [Oryza meyeriana var. granulata]